MKVSKQIRREAKRLFQLCIVGGSIDRHRVRQVVHGVRQSKRRDSSVFLSHFLRLVKLDESRHMAKVESATPLPTDLKSKILTDLERMYGPGMSTSFSLNASLIGGMRVRVASDVYDGSIKAGLTALEKRF